MSQDPDEPFELTRDQKYDLLEAIDHLKFLEPIAQSLSTLVEQERLTTTQSPPQPSEPEKPQSEIPAGASGGHILLADGRSAPAVAVRALTEYDATWPGSVIPEARAAVAYAVLSAVEESKEPVLRTNYPFCLDPSPDTLDSPCIKRADHRGKHQDNNDGTW
jgi:hypothetical protein